MFAWLRMGFCEYDICGENLDELSDYEENVAFRFVLVSACFIWLWHCFLFIPFLFLLLLLTELLWNVPDVVVGCMLGVVGSIPSLLIVKKSAVVSSFLLYAKPHNRNYVFLSGYCVRITGRLPDV
jgi:hypothetical protein